MRQLGKAARRTSPSPELYYSHGLHIPSRTIDLIGDVGDAATTFIRNFRLLEHQGPEPITVFLNSGGGSIVDGFAIFDVISLSRNHVTIQVYGEAASMAAVILQAGDARQMAPNAQLMLHDGEAAQDLQQRDFERFAADLKRCRERRYRIFAERSGKSIEHYRRKLAHDWHLTAKEALNESLIDEIIGG